MSNIEEAIEKLNKFNEYENADVLAEETLYEIQKSIEIILKELENSIPKEKVEKYLKEEQEKFEVYKKGSKTNENLKLGMWRHLGAKNMCEKILGIEKDIVALD